MNAAQSLNAWFCREVLPLEPGLMRFLQRHWRAQDEIADLRQDVYERVLSGAARERPQHTASYVFTIARNHMISRARRAKIVCFELLADLEAVQFEADLLTPERFLDARQELRRVEQGLDRLPPRCRQIVWLRKVEGLSTREVSDRLGIGIDAVEQQTSHGMRALVDFLLGGTGRIRRVRSQPRVSADGGT